MLIHQLNPVVGQFWFDSTNVEMSIWYSAPGDAWGQWVPVFSPAKLDDNLTTLKASQLQKQQQVLAGDTTLQTTLIQLMLCLKHIEAHCRTVLMDCRHKLMLFLVLICRLMLRLHRSRCSCYRLAKSMNGLTGDVGTIYTKYAKIDFVNEKVADTAI